MSSSPLRASDEPSRPLRASDDADCDGSCPMISVPTTGEAQGQTGPRTAMATAR